MKVRITTTDYIIDATAYAGISLDDKEPQIKFHVNMALKSDIKLVRLTFRDLDAAKRSYYRILDAVLSCRYKVDISDTFSHWDTNLHSQIMEELSHIDQRQREIIFK